MFGIDQTSASRSPSGRTPIGMFKCSAKRTALRARPSGARSLKIVIASRAASSLAAAKGYSMLCVTHSRPCASNLRFIGLWMSGSAATSSISKPGGSLNFFCCSAGERGSVWRTSAWAATDARQQQQGEQNRQETMHGRVSDRAIFFQAALHRPGEGSQQVGARKRRTVGQGKQTRRRQCSTAAGAAASMAGRTARLPRRGHRHACATGSVTDRSGVDLQRFSSTPAAFSSC